MTPELFLSGVRRRPVRLMLSVCGLAIVTFFAYRVIPVSMTTAGFAYLLLVLGIASTWAFSSPSLRHF